MADLLPRWSNRRLAVIVTAAAASLALALTQSVAQGNVQPGGEAVDDHGRGLGVDHMDDFDSRAGTVTASPAGGQLNLIESLGATVRWSPFGTPQSLIRHGDFLATGVPGASAAAAARGWLDDFRSLYQIDSVAGLEVHATVKLSGDAYVVVLRQRVGGLPVSPEGMMSIGLTGSPEQGWRVAYASSTLVPETDLTTSATVSTRDAFLAAAADAGADVAAGDVAMAGVQAGWRVLEVDGLEHEQLARQVAFPTYRGAARAAYEIIYLGGPEDGYRHIVDAATGELLLRENIVQHLDDEAATWQVYPAKPPTTGMSSPPWNFPGADTRDLWCSASLSGCDRVVGDSAGPPWDVDAQTGIPSLTTTGNAVDAFEGWFGGAPGQRPTSLDRRYEFPWTNIWYDSGCHPDNFAPGGNDIDASVTSLFAANWRMHTWSYHLGFTEETWNAQSYNFGRGGAENDPVLARAQAGAVTPGSRNNATMATRPDGVSSIMSMFLWQPQANAFYGPCVAGDFDMTVIGHEYTHMTENRLIGKGGRRSGFHAGAMGESWSDFIAAEYLNEYGLAGGAGADPFAVGAYVTGNRDRGIRNYNMSLPSAGQFPQVGQDVRVGTLNFGSMGYDIVGAQVHADSQIWSATNHDIRSLLLERYPSDGPAHQIECADGLRPVEDCPGNRRWIQLVFDAMLLMPTAPTMLDARDAYFAADLLRFDGANHDLLWLGFARRGFGEHASVSGTQDTDPTPSFESPLHEPATLHFEAVAKDEGGHPVDARVFVGNYEARATPLQPTERFVPNPEGYNFVAQAEGYGHVRFFVDNLQPGEERTITIHFPTNVASQSQGAVAAGDGIRHADLIDDTEATNWQSAPLFPNVVEVDPPSAAAGQYGAAGAAFGPEPTVGGLAGDIVVVNDGSADPTEGCDPLVGFPAGAIALVDRGSCAFTRKVGNAQAAGAVAVIVANNVPGNPFTMGGADATIEIPSVMVSLADGATIKGGLPATGRVRGSPSQPVAGSQVTVAFDGMHTLRHAKVSAMLLPGQNRFTALRQFELYACTAGGLQNPTCDGSTDAGWSRILRSHQHAFPAPNPRPSAPDLVLRGFALPTTTATHVKFVVVANQCTGNPDYQGEQHDDPASPSSDCRSTSVGSDEVRAAELQLLTSQPQVDGATLVG